MTYTSKYLDATASKYAVPQLIIIGHTVVSVALKRRSAKRRWNTVHGATARPMSLTYDIHSETAIMSFPGCLADSKVRLGGAPSVGSSTGGVLRASTVAIVRAFKFDRSMQAAPSFPTLSWQYHNLSDAEQLRG